MGLGSDFDGILHTGEIKDYENYPLLLARLEKVFSTKEMELITCGNALRVIREVIG